MAHTHTHTHTHLDRSYRRQVTREQEGGEEEEEEELPVVAKTTSLQPYWGPYVQSADMTNNKPAVSSL